MGNFTKQITREYDFDGDRIIVGMNRLKRKDAMTLLPYMKTDDEGKILLELKDQYELVEAAANVVKDNVTSFNGLVIDGHVVTLADTELMESVFGDIYFMPLVAQIIMDMMNASFVSKGEEKK